jgi:hypothetical protein
MDGLELNQNRRRRKSGFMKRFFSLLTRVAIERDARDTREWSNHSLPVLRCVELSGIHNAGCTRRIPVISPRNQYLAVVQKSHGVIETGKIH